MIHEKNFTLVPYIGETGNVQTHVRGGTRRIRGSHRLVPGRIGWRLSSQAKYGRDGQIYALHQLHRQPQRALIATLSSAQLFYSPKTTLSTQFVKPLITARKDLRFLKGIPSKQARGSGDFVAEVEGSLIRPGKRIPRTAFTHAEHHLALPDGLLFKRSEEWILRAAQEINNAWYPSFDTDAAALKIYQDYRKTLLVAKQNGKLSKDIYRRLWRRRDALRPNAQR